MGLVPFALGGALGGLAGVLLTPLHLVWFDGRAAGKGRGCAAGGVYAFFVSSIAPGSFPVLLSIQFLIIATVCGLGSVRGSVVGATVIYLMIQVLTRLGTLPGMPLHAPAVFSYAVYGLVLF